MNTDIWTGELKLVVKPDIVGLGRVIFNNRYYGLPVPVVVMLRRDEMILKAISQQVTWD
jgi:hypothetical protein